LLIFFFTILRPSIVCLRYILTCTYPICNISSV
jgi:hypothetical protein